MTLALGTRDAELAPPQQQPLAFSSDSQFREEPEPVLTYRRRDEPLVSMFSKDFSIGNSQIRDVILSSLSPSV